MRRFVLSLLLAGVTLAGSDGDVALQAGTIYLTPTDVIEGGTVLIHDGDIVAIGTDVEIPAGTRVVDYGEDAVLSPGLISATSFYGGGFPAAPRTAELDVRAIDNFDPYSRMADALLEGVTTVYMVPARGRLLAGRGAVVKTGGDADSDRVLRETCFLQGSIAADARRTPGYWEMPVPATVDVGLGVEKPQLPHSTMGAVVALKELMALVAGESDLEAEYGSRIGPALREAIEKGTPWRMRAESPEEVRALLEVFGEFKLPLILEGLTEVDDDLAAEIAAAGVPVICEPRVLEGSDYGTDPDLAGPDYTLVSTLARAGVQVVIATGSVGRLRFMATLAQRGGGLDRDAAFKAVTLDAARVLGIEDRVGSLAVGKDADIVVFSGHPLDPSSGVRATWVNGELAEERSEGGPVVIEVEELYLGDDEVLSPGQLLMRGGRIVEVGRHVAHPLGVTIVRGAAAMPGMIDALGHLGLERARDRFNPRFNLARIVEPGDEMDRRVARAGVTSVNLGGREASGQTMVYKPAGRNLDSMVVDASASIRLTWSNSIAAARGESMRKVLDKAKQYMEKWDKYEKDLAAWTPPPPATSEAKTTDAKGEGDKKDASDEDKEKEKKKKDKDEGDATRSVTGEWKGTAKSEALDVEFALRLRLLEEEDHLEGTLRAEIFEELWTVSGTREEKALHLLATSPEGEATLELTLEKGELKGTASHDGKEVEVSLNQTSDVYPVAARPPQSSPPTAKEPKGKPKPPGIDPELEPIRQAVQGKGAVLVTATSARDAIEATEACNALGFKPVIWTGDQAAPAAERLRGKVAGAIVRSSGAIWAEAGIPIAFYSGAEEGAGELPYRAASAISTGLSPLAAMRALTSEAATMLGVGDRIGRLRPGYDADVLLLDGSPFDLTSRVIRTWVNGKEIE